RVLFRSWDFLLYDKCVSEKNITLLLDTSVCAAETSGGKIVRALARSDTTRRVYEIATKIFVDATGDCRLAMEAGARVMSGRDGSKKYGEPFADFDPVGTRQGSTIMFTSKLCDKPVAFTPPAWAKKISPEQMKFRGVRGDGLAYGYWWIELGGDGDAIGDNERLRFELLSIVMGVWDYIKNSGKFPDAANRAIETVAMVPGRRDTFRIVGEKILTQHDLQGKWREFDDAVAVGGWYMDDHPAKGFNAPDRHPCRQFAGVPFYNIPLSALYCADISNLMMAGRNISCSHVAFTSTRVMSTCSAVGQAVGTAAARCAEIGISPAELRADKRELSALQQALLRDDQTILGISNSDPLDLARSAELSASETAQGSAPQNAVSGVAFDSPDSRANSWVAPIASKPSITLSWKNPVRVSQMQFSFFSGCAPLSQSLSDYVLKSMHRGAQKEIARDFDVFALLPDGSERKIAQVRANAQRLVRVRFETVTAKALRVQFLSTNGSDSIVLQEVRAYA
ncbi:MAG: FAD-dependent oxidoreductase, partial [Opitutales bacterium]|nr:FAD-dependent oxidoreductase [Opitutales bacterium]